MVFYERVSQSNLGQDDSAQSLLGKSAASGINGIEDQDSDDYDDDKDSLD